MKLNPSIKNMSNEYIFFTDQTALTFRICLVYVQFYSVKVTVDGRKTCGVVPHIFALRDLETGKNIFSLPTRPFLQYSNTAFDDHFWHISEYRYLHKL